MRIQNVSKQTADTWAEVFQALTGQTFKVVTSAQNPPVRIVASPSKTKVGLKYDVNPDADIDPKYEKLLRWCVEKNQMPVDLTYAWLDTTLQTLHSMRDEHYEDTGGPRE